MTDERRAGLREVRDWVAQHAMRWSKAPFGTTVVDAEELDAYLAALAPTQVPARDPDPMLGWRLAKCPHCGEELSVPAQEERETGYLPGMTHGTGGNLIPAQEERTKSPLIADDLAATLGVTTGASMATWQRWIAECPDLPAFRRALGDESKEEGASDG